MSLAEQIATLALSTFDKLPQRCKPRIQADGRREWTPMSAIIIGIRTDQGTDLNCISLGTGTKCLSASQLSRCNGLILHDSHAEILALRGLNRYLLQEIHHLAGNSEHSSLIIEPRSPHHPSTSTAPFRLRPTVSIYMFTTTAPCGDSSMDLLIANSTDPTPWSSESLTTAISSGQPLGRGHFSLLGAVRRKPARADAEPTTSKSCTDKIALKQFTSLLAYPVDVLLDCEGAFLTALVVYANQFDRVGYERAFGRSGRLSVVREVEGRFFDVLVLPGGFQRFEFEKAEGVLGKSKVTNVCAVWVAGSESCGVVIEVLVNGVKQGYRQFKERVGKGSVLCRRKMTELAVEIKDLLVAKEVSVDDLEGVMYSELKRCRVREPRMASKRYVTQKLGGWVTNSIEDDFSVESARSKPSS